MKSLVFALVLLIVVFTQASGQEQNQKEIPDEQIIVNKEFDENGNLIGYDSTYIHQWSSDSSFQFPFSNGDIFAGKRFSDINEFFKEFLEDTAMNNFSFPNSDPFSPFNNEDFFKQFQHSFSDSLLMDQFNFNNDSSIFLNKNFFENFEFPNAEEFQKRFQEQFKNYPNNFPEFTNPEQKEQWEKLMQKHQTEIEELQKEWEQKKKARKKTKNNKHGLKKSPAK